VGLDLVSARGEVVLARLVPQDVQAYAVPGRPNPELVTLQALQKSLPNAYTIFHSVHWSRETSRGTAIGEIDFIVLNRSGDALLIEQKTGELVETDQGLRKDYTDNKKSVADQIHRSLGQLKNKWNQANGRDHRLDIDYLLYCPDYRVKHVNAAGLDESRIVDASKADKLADVVVDRLPEGGAGSALDYERAEGFFAQQFELIPDISTCVQSQEKMFTHLTSDLFRLVDGLDFKPFRLRLTATAGSGKSHLGLRFYRQARERGERPLFVCFNNLLAHRIRAAAAGDHTVNTYHGWCRYFLDSIGETVDFSSVDDTPDFWKGIQERVVAADIPEHERFDCLIVDEGQDFNQSWWDILGLFLKPDAAVLWMEDPDQNVYSVEPVELDGFIGFCDMRNFRTPVSIADFIRETLGVEFESGNPLPGLGGDVFEWADGQDDPVKKIAHRIKELMRIGFKPKDIVVLSCVGQGKSCLGEETELGGIQLRRATGRYTDSGEQIFSDGQIWFDTVFRFKGQQAPAVLLIDAPNLTNLSERVKRVLFCGMTRAMVRLEIVVPA